MIKYYCPKCNLELEIIIFDCHHPMIDGLRCNKCNKEYDPCPSSFHGKTCRLTKGHKSYHISENNMMWPNAISLV